MHTGIMCHAIPVCIRGLNLITVCIRGSYRSLYAYRDRMTPIPVCIKGYNMHMGITVCISLEIKYNGNTTLSLCYRFICSHPCSCNHSLTSSAQYETQAASLSVIFPNALRAAIGEHIADLTGYILLSLLGTLIKSIPLAMINTM